MQNTKSVTLDYIFFELWPFEMGKWQNLLFSLVCQVSLKSVHRFRRRKVLKRLTRYGHGGHFGHVT